LAPHAVLYRKLDAWKREIYEKREASTRDYIYPNIEYFDKYWNARRPLADREKLSYEEVKWTKCPDLELFGDKPEPMPQFDMKARPLKQFAVGAKSMSGLTAPVVQAGPRLTPTQPVPEIEAELGAAVIDALEQSSAEDDHDSLCGDDEQDDATQPILGVNTENDGFDKAIVNAFEHPDVEDDHDLLFDGHEL
jgi:hypothetical protein